MAGNQNELREEDGRQRERRGKEGCGTNRQQTIEGAKKTSPLNSVTRVSTNPGEGA